ncbi:MAG: N-acetylmuramidase family protein [Pyrinomonadaceae bacterium]
MASSRKAQPENGSPDSSIVPAKTPGVLGLLDRADPNVVAWFGDTPGPLGLNDYAQPGTLQSTLPSARLQPAGLGVPPVQWITQPISQPINVQPVRANLLPPPSPSAPTLAEADFKNAAESLGVEVAVVKAVAEVESSGKGFDSKGRPRILFEAHWFHKFTKGKFQSKYPHLSQPTWALGKQYYKLDQWTRMEEAMTLDLEAALQSASWGKFQVMGFNHSGWDKVKDFAFAMFESEAQHLKSFLAYCKDRKLVTHLKKKDWAAFALGYNGSGYAANKYDVKLAGAYDKYRKAN